MIKPGIVLCSRLKSERLPGKAIAEINGVPLIIHTLRRLLCLNIPIIVAIPKDELIQYVGLFAKFPDLHERVELFDSRHVDDPLARTWATKNLYELTHVIRVTHDKIFVDTDAVLRALALLNEEKDADYIFSSQLTPGTAFEIISAKCLDRATEKFKNVEHISYAARLVSEKTIDLGSVREPFPFHLLVDFPEDLKLMEVLMTTLGNECTLNDVTKYLLKNPSLGLINCPPVVTVYTCVHNAEKYIEKAMRSVEMQRGFREYMEYLIVDDHSDDKTLERIAKFAVGKPNVKWIKNPENVGLASSSNIALKKARGRYVIRLDADDYFVRQSAIMDMLQFAQKTKFEVIYPDNYFGDLNHIQKGRDNHHPGGALFEKKALDYVKFTDGLRNYDGLDLFTRAKDTLKIGYYEERPIFFYTQRPNSMSKTNLEERARIRRMIEEKRGLSESKV